MAPAISFEFFPPAPGAPEARFWDTVERRAPLSYAVCRMLGAQPALEAAA